LVRWAVRKPGAVLEETIGKIRKENEAGIRRGRKKKTARDERQFEGEVLSRGQIVPLDRVAGS